ncbi:hypothetical protein QN277_005736 [Acacia crassicarpa]|uniref:F-box domain-containing protein n=1 Tax=Acacia crassicarpa TaxID=499986 RepID=A0AAE1IXR7_9FABA|nr:hypothetical protein QN277_005736 [Acacia crassicarpa]
MKIVIDIDVPFLYEEIIINILKRLPAKSLIRFQCVSKHWKSLIKNPSFTAEHLDHSTHQNPCLLFEAIDRRTLNLHLLDCEMQLRRAPNHPLLDYLKRGWVIGSSNGLLCIDISMVDCISHHSLLLYNPAIREIRQVPTTCTDFHGFVGFGFSPIVDDYKIVKIYVDEAYDVEKVEVYSLRTGSWKGLELGILNGACVNSERFTANGAIFWFGFKRDLLGRNGDPVIISFDIAMEVFTLLPRPALVPRSYQNRLATYENKLALLSCYGIRNYESFFIELWVMEEVVAPSGGRWSWTKKYTSNPYPHFVRPMTIWKNEIVCKISTARGRENDNPNTVLFNLTTRESTELAVCRSDYVRHIFNYVESIIPVGGM